MHTGELYLPNDDEIIQDQIKKLDRLYDFNMTRPTQLDKRNAERDTTLRYKRGRNVRLLQIQKEADR